MLKECQAINSISVNRMYNPPVIYSTNYPAFKSSENKKESKSSVKTFSFSSLGVLSGLAIAGAAFHVKLGKLIRNVGEVAPKSFFKRLAKISDIVTRDAMTGLYNKRALLIEAKKGYTQALKGNRNYSVAMFDMDNFKAINEIFDHHTGDIFLTRIAANIQEVCEKYGAKGFRYGGEEFVSTISDKMPQEARKIVKEIAEKIKNDDAIQKYVPEFLEKIKSDKNFLKPRLHLINNDIFRYLRENKTHSPEKAKQISEKIITLLEEHIRKYKPSNSDNLIEIINKLKTTPTNELASVLKLNMGVGNGTVLSNELDKISIQYKNMLNDLDKWGSHIDTHGKFTISGGLVNLSELKGEVQDGELMISIADAMLKTAKEQGKNRILSS